MICFEIGDGESNCDKESNKNMDMEALMALLHLALAPFDCFGPGPRPVFLGKDVGEHGCVYKSFGDLARARYPIPEDHDIFLPSLGPDHRCSLPHINPPALFTCEFAYKERITF